MPIITLTTDLGLKDGAPSMIKGSILKIAPETNIIDISHLINPQDVFDAASVLYTAVPSFPDNSIHVIVVDPGVGTKRRGIAAKIGNHFFVCPDNGILSFLIESAEESGLPIEIIHLTNTIFWNSEVSPVFHGRDIFGPVAAHLSRGVDIREFGEKIEDVHKISFPRSIPVKNGRKGMVVYVDNYGNVVTNFSFQEIGNQPNITVRILNFVVTGLQRAFGDNNPGELILLYNSVNTIMISVVNGNAAQKIGAKVGDEIELIFG